MDLLTGRGRVGRLGYAATSIVLGLAAVFVYLFVADRDRFTDEVELTASTFGALVVLAWLQIMNSVRRLHDRGHGGYLVLLLAVPVIGFIVELYLLFAPGTPGWNRFGVSTGGRAPQTSHDRVADAEAANRAARNDALLDASGSFDMDGLWRESDIRRD